MRRIAPVMVLSRPGSPTEQMASVKLWIENPFHYSVPVALAHVSKKSLNVFFVP